MVSGGAVLVVADTLRKHGRLENGRFMNAAGQIRFECRCGEFVANRDAHVAAAVVDALGGLTRAWAPVFDDDSFIDPPFHEKHEQWPGQARTRAEQAADYEDAIPAFRWVSGWVREPAEEGKP